MEFITLECKSARSSALCYKFPSIFKNTKGKICQDVWGFHNVAMYICKGNKNSNERVFTNFSYTSIETTRNYSQSQNSSLKDQPRLWYRNKKVQFDYDMKLVIFGIDKDKNLIVQFPVFIKPYTQQPHILYKIGTVPVSIID